MKSTRKLKEEREKGSWKVNNGSRVAGVTFATQWKRLGLAANQLSSTDCPFRYQVGLGGYIGIGRVCSSRYMGNRSYIMYVLSLVNVGSFHVGALVVSLFVEVVPCDVGRSTWGVHLRAYIYCVEVRLLYVILRHMFRRTVFN